MLYFPLQMAYPYNNPYAFNPYYNALDYGIGAGYGLPYGNYFTGYPPVFRRPKKQIDIIKRGIVFSLDAKSSGPEDEETFIVLCTVSIPKIGMFGTAQFVQDYGDRIDEQVVVAAS